MSSESADSTKFWAKMHTYDDKTYLDGDYYEFIASLVLIKFNCDAKLKFSKYPDWFTQDNLKHANRILRKFPDIWSKLDTPGYYDVLMDKNKRKFLLYKILGDLK